MSNYSLDKLKCGECAVVTELETDGIKRRRLQDLGVIEGALIESLFKSPHNDPTAYCIRGCVVALRKEDASKIIVKKQSV